MARDGRSFLPPDNPEVFAMPPTYRRAPRATIRSTLPVMLGLLWLAAAATQWAPPTEALPPSGYQPTAASFAPVWVDAPIADALASAAPAASHGATPGLLAEVGRAPGPTGRPAVRQPAAAVGVTAKVMPTSHSLRGRASWYCRAGVSVCMAAHPDRAGADMYAAAGPGLRRAMCGSESSNCWRNRRVLVNGVAVVLADWCGCNTSASSVKLIDLYWDAWVRVPGVESGVTIRW